MGIQIPMQSKIIYLICFLYSEVKKKGEIFMVFLKLSESEQRDPTYPGVAYKCFTDT